MKLNYKELNKKHCQWVDKLYRQFGGLSSEIISFKNLTIELKIEISERWPKDPTTTAIQIAKDWRHLHDCLKTARFYKVTLVFFNPDQDTGGIVKPSQYQDSSSIAQELWNTVQRMNNPGKNSSILLTGPIDDENGN
jgi:hypothetical protein